MSSECCTEAPGRPSGRFTFNQTEILTEGINSRIIGGVVSSLCLVVRMGCGVFSGPCRTPQPTFLRKVPFVRNNRLNRLEPPCTELNQLGVLTPSTNVMPHDQLLPLRIRQIPAILKGSSNCVLYSVPEGHGSSSCEFFFWGHGCL